MGRDDVFTSPTFYSYYQNMRKDLIKCRREYKKMSIENLKNLYEQNLKTINLYNNQSDQRENGGYIVYDDPADCFRVEELQAKNCIIEEILAGRDFYFLNGSNEPQK